MLVAIAFLQVWVSRVESEFTDFDRAGDRMAFGTFGSFGQVSLETGKKLWAVSLKEGQIGTRVTADAKTTIANVGNGPIFAYDTATGKLRWSLPHRGYASPVALIGGKNALVEVTPNSLQALDVYNHLTLWKQAIETQGGDQDNQLASKPLAVGAELYIAGRRGSLLSLDPDTGEIRWKADLGDSPATTLVADQERLYATSARGVLFAVSRRTGTIYWHFDAGNTIAGKPLIQEGRVLIVSSGGYEICVSALEGTMLWQSMFSRDQDFSVTGPIALGPNSLFLRRSGAVALDKAGHPDWQTTLPYPASFRSPEPYRGDYIFFDSHAIYRMRPQ